ncbi:diaminopimelate decarboxylase [Paramicrobacterium chengjingii]|uniref:Diaminopimelate decarboxylase n=1 Tax=Paramicrobacterium chengjingii TaxID=2769067 RepID=A0ABX6YEN6_9MICO|nr:diaminopimelate decarboxylase [Microbacterium chengjingii]QPZ37251.1 diaminopimelate decarboxylase [Microbacterium chengjingii]
MTHNPLAPSWLVEPDDANALAPGLWPSTAARAESGELQIGGVSAHELAQQFGTPLYVVDERDARERAGEVREALHYAFAQIGSRAHVYYAGKALLTSEVARWMVEAGCRIDVCSGGELGVALAAGVEADRIGFHGNNKSLSEIDRAVASGVGTIIIDSIQEIDRVAEAAVRHGARQRVRLRVNSGVHAHTHEFLATSHEDQKFGLTLEAAPDAVARIRAFESLEFIGLHCHIGSQIFGSGGFAESAARLLAVHKELLRTGPVAELNLGGGFGIAYTSVDDPTPIGELAEAIARIVSDECELLRIPIPDVAFEPGRTIIGTAGVTLYEAGTTKPVDVETESGTKTRLYVSVDGGMSDNARTALYDADYSVRIASRRSDAAPALVRIAGKHCESGDIVVSADYLPSDVEPGDLLAVPATGAYCWSLASNYNYLGRPPIVAVRDGRARVIVRGETEADLMARDAGLDGR